MRVRFAATLGANLIRAVASFAAGAVVARGLGASNYGDLNFLLASFAAFLPLLDAGTSSAFFTFLSREPRGRRFFALFGGWLAIQALVPIALVTVLLPDRIIRTVWLDQPRAAVVLAFVSVFLTTQVWGAVSRMGEARRLTVRVQMASVVQALAHLLIVSVAAAAGWLTVMRVIMLLTAEFALLCLVVAPRLLKENLPAVADPKGTRETVREFWSYCRPLLLYGWVGVPYAFADRWMLQAYGGSAEQGYFSLGSQFANIALLATSSILSVFWKEVVDAIRAGDRARVRLLHHRVTRILYFAAAWLSCALIPYSAEILRWTAGASYASAAPTLALLLVYPVHQSLGQIQGTFLHASDDTGTYAFIGVVTMLASIPVTYFLLAPRGAAMPGLSLGANGLALKMVVLQVIGVNLQAWFIARRNGWTLDLWFQLRTFVVLLGLSALLREAVTALVGLAGVVSPLAVTIAGPTLFVAISTLFVLRWPAAAGLSQAELQQWWAAARRILPTRHSGT